MPDYDLAIQVRMDAEEVLSQLQQINDQLSNLPGSVEINFTTDDAVTAVLENIQETLNSLQGYNISITAEDNASDIIEDMKSSLENLPDEVSTVISAEDEASNIVEDVSSKLEELDGKEVTTTISVEGGEEAAEETSLLTGSMGNLGKTVAGITGAIASYQMLIKGLDYRRAIEMAAEYTNATQRQKEEMEKLIQENMSVQLGAAGTAQVMTILARYTGDATESMGYFRAVMDAIKVTGEDATSVTLTLMNTFKEFNITTKESYGTMARLIQLYNVSGYPSFVQFLNVVDRLGLTLEQMGYSVEDVAGIVAAVGPQGTMILRGFTTQLYNLNSEWVSGSEKAQEYAKRLENIGIATRDAQGNMRSLRDVLNDFIVYLEKLPSHEERVKVATGVFGDTMGRALVSISEGYDKVEKASSKSAEQQIKDIKKIKKETRDPLATIKFEIEKLIPGFSDLSSVVSQAATAFLHFAMPLKILDDLFLKGKLSEKLSELVSKGFKSMVDWIKSKLPFDLFKSFGKTLGDEIKKTGDLGVKYLEDFAKRFWKTFSRLFGEEGGKVSIGWIDDFAKSFTTKLPSLAEKLTPALSKIASIASRALGEGIVFSPEDLKLTIGEKEYNKMHSELMKYGEEQSKWYSKIWEDYSTWWLKTWNDSMTGLQMSWSNFSAWVSSTFANWTWPKLPDIKLPDLLGSIQSAWNKFTSWVLSVFPKFKWPKLPSVSMPNIKGVFEDAWKKFTDTVTDVFRKFKWPKLPIPNFSDIAKKFYDWGKDFINDLTKGIWDAMPSFQGALNWIRLHLPHSPPEIGPLADVTEESMRKWMGNIISAGAEVLDSFAAKIGGIENITTSASIGYITPNVPEIQVTVKISEGAVMIHGGADETVMRDAAQILGDEIVRSVISEGINVRWMRW